MFRAQPVVAGVTLHAFIPIDGGAFHKRVNVDRSHRAYVGAVSAGDAFIGIDFHFRISLIADVTAERWGSIRVASRAAMIQRTLAVKKGQFHPNRVER